MKLLILTQKVDKNDPTLGFFHRWIEEFANHYENLTIICLEKGIYTLPKNVQVLSLGKEEALSKVSYVLNFYRYIWRERKNYESVFVHMNSEYLILAGLLWRWWNKKVGLWYTHKNISIRLRLAVLLAHVVFSASPESFRIKTRKLRVMGHGIDTDFFSPANSPREDVLLSVGRLSKIKRHDLVLRVASCLDNGEVRIAGDGPERQRLESLAKKLGVISRVKFLGGLNQKTLLGEYQRARVLIHTSETGSLDKAVLEALSTGLPVVTTSNLSGLPVTHVEPEPEKIAEAVFTPQYTNTLELINFVKTNHSLKSLISRLSDFLENSTGKTFSR